MIIFEIGLNHLGIEKYANFYIDEILKTKADAITFALPKESFFENERFRDFKLEKEFFIKASEKIKNGNMDFGISIDDEGDIDFLETLGVSFYKVLSKDINNIGLIDDLINNTDKRLFVSTGMSDLSEIEAFCKHVESVKERFTLVHTQLTHDIKDVNLKAIDVLKNRFNLPVAFGMHSSNHNVLYLSLTFEPSDIFIYVKGVRTASHPDEEHAIPLEDIKNVVNNLLELPQSIGEGVKLKMDDWVYS